MNFCVLQIKSFIESLCLSGKSSSEEKQQPGHLPGDHGSSKGDKKANTIVSLEAEAMSKMDKKKKDIERAENVSNGKQFDKEIDNQLLHLSVKSYKRLLVSVDSEVMWYEQVSLNLYLRAKCDFFCLCLYRHRAVSLLVQWMLV